MCIGTPMKVVSNGHGMAVAEGRGQTERLNMLMVGELPPGTWVLAFQGSALRVISAEEAAQTDAALDALAAVLAGGSDTDTQFRDLVDREPQLPVHLQARPQETRHERRPDARSTGSRHPVLVPAGRADVQPPRRRGGARRHGRRLLAQAGHALLVFTRTRCASRKRSTWRSSCRNCSLHFRDASWSGCCCPRRRARCSRANGFNRWPALVMLKDGQYVGAIDGLRNWDDYLDGLADPARGGADAAADGGHPRARPGQRCRRLRRMNGPAGAERTTGAPMNDFPSPCAPSARAASPATTPSSISCRCARYEHLRHAAGARAGRPGGAGRVARPARPLSAGLQDWDPASGSAGPRADMTAASPRAGDHQPDARRRRVSIRSRAHAAGASRRASSPACGAAASSTPRAGCWPTGWRPAPCPASPSKRRAAPRPAACPRWSGPPAP